jgi:hydroxypyruvate reductase
MPRAESEGLLREMFAAAVGAASPARVVAAHLPPQPAGRVLVLGAGKASAAMARAVELAWPAADLRGLVVTRHGHGVPCRRIEIVEAGHPAPDAAGEAAARRMLALAREAGPDDLVLALISGGGSALLTLPAPGLALADKQAVNAALLRSGAPIAEINCVRKHLSAIKGGRLALAAAPARLFTLAISDVVGDDPTLIASGPTLPDPTTYADALAVLRRRGVDRPRAAIAHLEAAADETPKPGDTRLPRSETVVAATAATALAAAADVARLRGVTPILADAPIEGEARAAARDVADQALAIRRGEATRALPCVLISGGETTVTVRGAGRGGPNSEFLLALAIALDGAPGVQAIACDTDAIDGSEDNAGAMIDPTTLERARRLGLDANDHLARNDAYPFFAALGDLVMTGPTGTNVNDFRAVLIEARVPA